MCYTEPMNEAEVRTLARTLLDQHGLNDWRLRLGEAKGRLGSCSYRTKTIAISMAFARINPEERIKNTILHEIAHALVGPGYSHGPVWKAMARRVGANPAARTDAVAPPRPPKRYVANCMCGVQFERARKPEGNRYCNGCYNRGLRQPLIWHVNPLALRSRV